MNASAIRENITNIIVASLEQGGLPCWRKPWANDPNGLGLATSLSTGHAYRGINQLVLQAVSSMRGYKSRWFGTYQQVRLAGESVRKGEKAIKVVLWKPIKRERANASGEKTEDSFLVMREFSVFSVEQTTGLDQFRVGYAQPNDTEFERHEMADNLFDAIGADTRFGGNKAFYSPSGDYIQMPHRHQFETAEGYFETLAHECIHWSEKRIGFDRSKFDNAYALGELVAELGSCFLMCELGLSTTDNLGNHAAYVADWLRGMKNDTKFVFDAAATASKAVEFLLSHIRQPAEESTPVSAA